MRNFTQHQAMMFFFNYNPALLYTTVNHEGEDLCARSEASCRGNLLSRETKRDVEMGYAHQWLLSRA